jgi:RimJ/RimL family protein N-acetyltransferase
VRLVSYADEDLWLTRALETDPAVMAELGGAQPEAAIAPLHERRLRTLGRDNWWLTIRPDDDETRAGTIGIWPREWNGTDVHETGWMVLPAFQGRGIASRALALLLEQARADGGFDALHAWPGRENAASNALCRRFGFEVLEDDVGVEYAGRALRVRHWALTL